MLSIGNAGKDKAQSLHYVVMLAARRNARKPWMRILRKEAFGVLACEREEKAMQDRVKQARADESIVRDKLAKSAEWRVYTTVYQGGKSISTTYTEGRGRFRLLQLGIGAQRA